MLAVLGSVIGTVVIIVVFVVVTISMSLYFNVRVRFLLTSELLTIWTWQKTGCNLHDSFFAIFYHFFLFTLMYDFREFTQVDEMNVWTNERLWMTSMPKGIHCERNVWQISENIRNILCINNNNCNGTFLIRSPELSTEHWAKRVSHNPSHKHN